MRAIEISGTNRSQAITLPVNPLSFEISQGQVNQTVTLLNMGEVNLLGNRGLITVSFSSLFPASSSPLARYADREPEEYISQLQRWKNRKKTVRLIIGGTDINFAASIERLATAALMALGCHLCRSCQKGLCNWGIATQRPELTARLDPEDGVRRLVNLVTAWKHEIKEMMGGMGINSIEALRGNRLMLRGVGLNEKELSILGVRHAGE